MEAKQHEGNNKNLYSMNVKLIVGENIMPITAVYQDTSPNGSEIGTVVMTHGSPGKWTLNTPNLWILL